MCGAIPSWCGIQLKHRNSNIPYNSKPLDILILTNAIASIWTDLTVSNKVLTSMMRTEINQHQPLVGITIIRVRFNDKVG
jgi:hypothetical protein